MSPSHRSTENYRTDCMSLSHLSNKIVASAFDVANQWSLQCPTPPIWASMWSFAFWLKGARPIYFCQLTTDIHLPFPIHKHRYIHLADYLFYLTLIVRFLWSPSSDRPKENQDAGRSGHAVCPANAHGDPGPPGSPDSDLQHLPALSPFRPCTPQACRGRRPAERPAERPALLLHPRDPPAAQHQPRVALPKPTAAVRKCRPRATVPLTAGVADLCSVPGRQPIHIFTSRGPATGTWRRRRYVDGLHAHRQQQQQQRRYSDLRGAVHDPRVRDACVEGSRLVGGQGRARALHERADDGLPVQAGSRPGLPVPEPAVVGAYAAGAAVWGH